MPITVRSFVLLCALSFTGLATPAFAAAESTATDGAASPYAAPPPVSTSATGGPGTPAPSPRGASLWGMLPWGGVGVGGRIMTPLSIAPVLGHTNIRDSFALEYGADFLHFSHDYGYGLNFSHNEIVALVGMMWNLWFSDQFALYPKVEAGYAFAWISGLPNGVSSSAYGYGGVFFSGAAGALYKTNSGLTLRAEAGVSGLKVGVGWLF